MAANNGGRLDAALNKYDFLASTKALISRLLNFLNPPFSSHAIEGLSQCERPLQSMWGTGGLTVVVIVMVTAPIH